MRRGYAAHKPLHGVGDDVTPSWLANNKENGS